MKSFILNRGTKYYGYPSQIDGKVKHLKTCANSRKERKKKKQTK